MRLMAKATEPTTQTSADQAPPIAWVSRVMDVEGPGILRMLWRILGCEADVLDAYQDCFCNLAKRARQGQINCERAYVWRAATNIAVEMVRRRGRRSEHLSAIAHRNEQVASYGMGETSGEVEGLDALRRAVADLPAHLRNVVVLRDLCRLSYEDVAERLGITPATARVYRRHAVVKLTELMEAGG